MRRNPTVWFVSGERFRFVVLSTLLLIASFLAAMFFTVQAVRFLPVTGDNVYPESAGVLAAQRWAQGLPLYADYRQPPYLMTVFPPLWYALLALLAKAGISNLDDLVLAGRLLSLGCVTGIAVIGFAWNRRMGFSRESSLLASSFFLSVPLLIPWAVTARPDFLAILLAAVGLYWAGLGTNSAAVIVAAFFASLAVLAKHNTVAVPIAVALWLLWSRRWQHSALFTVTFAVVTAAALLPFYLSGGTAVVLNLSGAKFGSFATTYIRDVLARTLTREGNGFGVALIALGTFGFFESRSGDARLRLVRIYLVVSLLLAVLGTAAAGGGGNHYFELFFAMALLVPAGIDRLRADWRSDSPAAVFATIVTAALIIPSLDVQRSKATHNAPEDLRPLLPLIQNRRVFTDDPHLAARVSSPQAIDLSSLVNTLKRGGWAAWSSAQISEEVRQKKFELVILRTPMRAPYFPYNPSRQYPRTHRLDLSLQNAIVQNYRVCAEMENSDEYGRLYLYAPVQQTQDTTVDLCPLLKNSVVHLTSTRRRSLQP